MKAHLFTLVATLAVWPALAGQRSSANYLISADVVDGGGAPAGYFSYLNYGSGGGIGGVSQDATGVIIANQGFAGQLYSLSGIKLTAVASTLLSGSNTQLSASVVLDDSSQLPLNPAAVTWAVVSGPVTVTSNGLVTAGNVSQSTPATVRATGLGQSATLQLVVLPSGTQPCLPPVIQQQPKGTLAMAEGSSHLLSVLVADTGSCPPGFQWFRNDAAVPGATQNSLLLNPLTSSNAGAYTVVVSNLSAAVTSSVATVQVLQGATPFGSFGHVGGGGSLWYFTPKQGIVFTLDSAGALKLRASDDLIHWQTLEGGITVVNGVLKMFDPFAVLHGNRYYRLSYGTPPAPPTGQFDPSGEIPLSVVPAATIALAQEYIQEFNGAAIAGSEDEHDWENVSFAPTARYLYDPGYQNGDTPAYVELRVLGPGGAGDGRGYLLLSLTDEDFPVVEFSTRGGTKTDVILQHMADGSVRKFVRFSPGYIVGEDANGRPLGRFGTAPLTLVDSLPAVSQHVTASFDSESGIAVRPVPTSLNFAPAPIYEALKADFQNNPARLQLRTLRKAQAAARWRLANGIRNPVLNLQVGQTMDFLTDQMLVSVSAESEPDSSVARLSVLPTGGFRATGAINGSDLVRIQTQSGFVDFYPLLVGGTSGRAKKAGCPSFETLLWYAGTGWYGDQRQYDQLQRPRWCPDDGCGPTALAMLLGWWDANGVPSAWYRLESGKGNAHKFRFNFDSLHDQDAPKANITSADEDNIVDIYDDFFGLCNTMCFSFTDAGATYPDQEASAFDEYTRRISTVLKPPQNEFGDQFIGVSWSASWVAPGVSETDWEGGGKIVARGIKNNNPSGSSNGYPGIIGIGSSLGDSHYPLAYAYREIRKYEGCGSDRHVVDIWRAFKCNMGWGPDNLPEWEVAEDVWFGLSAHLWQKQLPTKPMTPIPLAPALDDHLATDPRRPAAVSDATGNRVYLVENSSSDFPAILRRIRSYDGGNTWYTGPDSSLGAGVFTSEPAAALSADGRKWHVFARGTDQRIWRAFSPNAGTNWTTAWEPIGENRMFLSAPAAACSADGSIVHVIGQSYDAGYWHAVSLDYGATWSAPWNPVATGTFLSAPSLVASSNGQILYAFGMGTDGNYWRAYSTDGGVTWVGWSPIGIGSFTSSPAAVGDATLQKLRVFGRGSDNGIWYATSNDGGANWASWFEIGTGVFSSAPAAAASANGQSIQVFGRGLPAPPPPPGVFPDPNDPRIWQAYSADGGSTWSLAWGEIVPLSEISP